MGFPADRIVVVRHYLNLLISAEQILMLKYLTRIMRTVVVLMLLLNTTALGAEGRIVVEKMETAALDRLMQDPDNPRMIVAMAAWCGPCRKELPTLIKLFDKYKDQGLKMVGISLDANGPQAMQPIFDKLQVNFPVNWVGVDMAKKYDIYAIPMIFFIKNGQVVEKLPGQRSYADLDRKIKELFELP
jgi:thiol-disulfide isomerase/thioredoxin